MLRGIAEFLKIELKFAQKPSVKILKWTWSVKFWRFSFWSGIFYCCEQKLCNFSFICLRIFKISIERSWGQRTFQGLSSSSSSLNSRFSLLKRCLRQKFSLPHPSSAAHHEEWCLVGEKAASKKGQKIQLRNIENSLLRERKISFFLSQFTLREI